MKVLLEEVDFGSRKMDLKVYCPFVTDMGLLYPTQVDGRLYYLYKFSNGKWKCDDFPHAVVMEIALGIEKKRGGK